MLKALFSGELGFELRRQAVHMTGGVIISVLAYFMKPLLGWTVVLPVIAGVLAFLAIPRLAPQLKVSSDILFHFERKDDLRTLPYKGAICFGLGIIPALILLPTKTACAAIMVLSVGDAFSTVSGKYFRPTLHSKTFEGFAAFVLSSFIACLVYVDVRTAALFSIAGGLAELDSHINDNVSIPLTLTALYLIVSRIPKVF